MENVTNFLNFNDSGLTIGNSEITAIRVDSQLIFIENCIVAICLYTHRNKFSKKEFWLQLVGLTFNDLFASVALFILSFINYDIFSKNIYGCFFLIVLILVSQMGLLFTVLSVCVYRFMFLVCSDRYRFGWTTKMTVIQIVGVYSFCTMYQVTALALWGNLNLDKCTAVTVFGDGKQKAFVFIGAGLILPLIFVNVLYCVTFHLLRRHMSKRAYFEQVTAYSRNLGAHDLKKSENEKMDIEEDCVDEIQITHNYGNPCSDLSHESFPLEQFNEDSKPAGTNILKSQLHHKDSFEKKRSHFNTKLVNIPENEHMAGYTVAAEDNRYINQNLRGCSVNWLGTAAKRSNQPAQSPANDLQKQSLCLIGLILLLIDLTTLPTVVYLITEKAFPPESLPRTVKVFFCVLVLNNSLLNPWVYAIQCQDFRSALINNVKGLFCHFNCLNALFKSRL